MVFLAAQVVIVDEKCLELALEMLAQLIDMLDVRVAVIAVFHGNEPVVLRLPLGVSMMTMTRSSASNGGSRVGSVGARDLFFRLDIGCMCSNQGAASFGCAQGDVADRQGCGHIRSRCAFRFLEPAPARQPS